MVFDKFGFPVCSFVRQQAPDGRNIGDKVIADFPVTEMPQSGALVRNPNS